MKAVIVRKDDLKVCQTKKSYKVRVKSGRKGNDVKIKKDVSSNKNVNVTLV